MANSKEIGRIGQRRYGGTIYEEFLHELKTREEFQETLCLVFSCLAGVLRKSCNHSPMLCPVRDYGKERHVYSQHSAGQQDSDEK